MFSKYKLVDLRQPNDWMLVLYLNLARLMNIIINCTQYKRTETQWLDDSYSLVELPRIKQNITTL